MIFKLKSLPLWWAFCILADMININTIYKLVKQSLGQYQKINVLPSVFNSSYQMAEIDLMNDLLGNNTNNPNISRSRQLFVGVNNTVNEQLKPFIKTSIETPSSGVIAINSDKIFDTRYLNIGASGISATYKSINLYNKEIGSEIDKPPDSYPIWTISDNSILFYPNVGISTAKVTFIQHPFWDTITASVKKPEWKYTGTGTNIQYDAINSVDSRFLDISLDRLISGTLKYLGISLKDPAVSQFSNQIKNEI